MKISLSSSSIPREDLVLVPKTLKRLYLILIILVAIFSGRHQLAVQAQEIVPQDAAVLPSRALDSSATASASPSAILGQVMNVVIGKGHYYTQPAASPQSQGLLAALNQYREKHGKNKLVWSTTLAAFAQRRADGFQQKNDLDEHAGFHDLIANHDGFMVLGFWSLAENSAIGQRVSATDLIETVYGTSPAHNATELNNSYVAVGIGIAGTATDFIFGGVPAEK